MRASTTVVLLGAGPAQLLATLSDTSADVTALYFAAPVRAVLSCTKPMLRTGGSDALRNGPQRLVEHRPHGGVARDSASVGEFARVCVGGVVKLLAGLSAYVVVGMDVSQAAALW